MAGEVEQPQPTAAAPAAAAPLQPVAYATVLYAFAGSNEGELPVAEGDQIAVLEDDGSGWVRAALNGQEGYVPQSYIQYLAATA